MLDVLDARLVHQRTGRRRTICAIVRVAGPGGVRSEETWYAKEYSSSKGARSYRKQMAIRNAVRHGVSVPEPLGYSVEDRLLVMREVPCRSLEALLRDPARDLSAVLDHAGEALNGLHELETRMLPPDASGAFGAHGPREESLVLRAAGARVEGAPFEGTLRMRFQEALETTIVCLGSDPPSNPGLLHRDLHPAQVVPVERGIVLLDTDETAFGEPELDVGNLAAHLTLEAIRRSAGSDDGGVWAAALTSGYSRKRALQGKRLGLYTAAALLRLASLERVARADVSRLDWPRLANALVDAAQRELSAVTRTRPSYPSSL
ncbi:MAG TPA: phosphotransferase [Candidatus Eisenbacteria bacterium]|nr:phosphotransferase [Candidatus Eisenbacteria bacterium]